MADPRKTDLESQVWLWIKKNKNENTRLEFKLRVDLSTPGAKAEFIRDVISLANSEGENPRREGHLVIGFRNGKRRDVRVEHYDGARFGELLDSYIYPPVNTAYEEYGSRHRLGVLIVKPDADTLYVATKKIQDDKGQALLVPGQCWGRKSDRKVELSGEAIHRRLREIVERKIEAATDPLEARIEKLERERGVVLEVKRLRYKMEATGDWSQLEALIPELLPYAREYDFKVKNEVIDALATATGRASQGMTIGVAGEVDSVLGELMPVGTGGVHHPSRTEISTEEQALLERIGNLTFEMTWNACRYLRNMEIVEVGAMRFWYLIRFATLNGLRHAQAQFLRDARSCRDICNEEAAGEPFVEARDKLDEQIKDALDAFSCDYIVATVKTGELTTKIVTECVAIIKTGEAVDWRSAKRELPLASHVVVAYHGSQIAGVGVIKRERRDYAADISKKSGFSFPAETPELGYVAVAPKHQGRGLSLRIAKLLVSDKGPLFATTYEERMMKTLTRVGFVKKGSEWRGRQQMLSLWCKE